MNPVRTVRQDETHPGRHRWNDLPLVHLGLVVWRRRRVKSHDDPPDSFIPDCCIGSYTGWTSNVAGGGAWLPNGCPGLRLPSLWMVPREG